MTYHICILHTHCIPAIDYVQSHAWVSPAFSTPITAAGMGAAHRLGVLIAGLAGKTQRPVIAGGGAQADARGDGRWGRADRAIPSGPVRVPLYPDGPEGDTYGARTRARSHAVAGLRRGLLRLPLGEPLIPVGLALLGIPRSRTSRMRSTHRPWPPSEDPQVKIPGSGFLPRGLSSKEWITWLFWDALLRTQALTRHETSDATSWNPNPQNGHAVESPRMCPPNNVF